VTLRRSFPPTCIPGWFLSGRGRDDITVWLQGLSVGVCWWQNTPCPTSVQKQNWKPVPQGTGKRNVMHVCHASLVEFIFSWSENITLSHTPCPMRPAGKATPERGPCSHKAGQEQRMQVSEQIESDLGNSEPLDQCLLPTGRSLMVWRMASLAQPGPAQPSPTKPSPAQPSTSRKHSCACAFGFCPRPGLPCHSPCSSSPFSPGLLRSLLRWPMSVHLIVYDRVSVRYNVGA
jgi:hypothetical protein